MQQALKTVRTLLPSSGSVTLQQIEEAVDQILFIPRYSTLDKDELLRTVQSHYNIRVDDFKIIESHERRIPWLKEIKAKIEPNFWKRYYDYLKYDKNYPEDVLNKLDTLTDRTLDGLFNPEMKEGISKYGLVVGQVQSGKTSNYTGLICKAADAGFKIIIVLAGIHNNLRSQTQLRLDEGFLGFDTQHQRAFDANGIMLGVGRFNKLGIAHSITTSLEKGDFTLPAANSLGINFNTSEPIIAVVKKNSSVLARIITWLSSKAIALSDGTRIIDNKSLLIIDDEADNASINTNPEEDKSTRINGQIRDIIRLFHRSGYVGYTATPFANIFIPIEEDQLFPRDFIINIPAPSNYIGPDKIFGITPLNDDEVSEAVLPIVNRINDYADLIPDGHRNLKKNEDITTLKPEIQKRVTLPDDIPESMYLAIKCFIITCAIRRLRGHENAHNSMLIHVSRLISWQTRITEIVDNVFNYYRRGIEFNTEEIIEEFKDAFENDSDNYRSYISVSQQILDSDLNNVDASVKTHKWGDVKKHLYEAASRIVVKQINGGSADTLNYFDHKNGLSVIAVGGDKLSRGLTLEGLSVSYFLRASRMYDTLMQMGRWFGYRPGYVDLCRLFTSYELNEWFCHVTLASEELRSEFDYLADVAGSTPEQYALKVRTHPGVLQISASNKIRRAVNIDVSWAGRLVETYQLHKDKNTIESNLLATKQFISSLSGHKENSNNYYWDNVTSEKVKIFLHNFRVPDSLVRVNPENLIQFISKQNSNNEIISWNVALMTKKKAKNLISINIDGEQKDIGLIYRKDSKVIDLENTYSIRKNHIISPSDEFIDLTEEQFERALLRSISLNKDYKSDYPKGEIVRNEIRDPKNALLLIYLLDPTGADLDENSSPITGFAISFPRSKYNAAVRYAVHEQLLPLFNIDDDIENDNNDED